MRPSRQDLSDRCARKELDKRVVESFYNHQVNDKQELNRSVLNKLYVGGDLRPKSPTHK